MDPQQPNKKSLKKAKGKTLSRRQQLQDDLVASDIASRMQLGISEIEIFSDVIDQQIPMDEIQMAFGKIGMSENDFNSLVSNYQQAMSGQQQAGPDYAMPPQMQFGGGSVYFPSNISQGNRMKGSDYIPAQGTYLPQDLGNKGNVLGAVSTLAEGAANLFGRKDRDGDGLMDGAFRDSQAKRRAFKRGKASQFDYTDSEGDPIGGGEYSDEELFKASKDPNYIPRKQVDLAKEYSRFGTDEEGGLQMFITDRPFDKRDYTKSKKSPYNRNKLEDLYSGMKPAGEFDFNPFMKAAQEEQQAEEESEARAEEAVQERKIPSVAAEEAVVEEATVPNTSTAPAVSAVSPSKPVSISKTPSSADQFFSPYATKNFSPVTYKLADGSTQTYKTADDLYKGIIDPNMSYVDAERLFEAGYGRMDNGQFTQLTNYTTPGTGQYGAADNYLTSTDQVTNYATNSPATYSQYGPAKNVPKHGIETDLPGFANASKPVQDMLRMVHFNTGIDPRVFVADASGQFKGNRGDYSVRGTGDISTIYNEDMLKSVDPQKLLESINDIYRSLVKNTGSLAEQNPSYAKRVQFLADRYNLNVPQNTYTPARQRGGDLVKYQSLGEFLDEDNDGISDNIDETFEMPNMLPEVVINSNSQLPKIEPLPMQKLPSIDFPETLEYIDEPEFDSQIGSINKKRKSGSRMKRFLDSPGINKFSSAANFGVAAAGVANEMFQNKRAFDAENELDLKTADDLYGTFEERDGDRGMYDVNTGLAQPDNLDVGYAMNGMEMPMMGAPMPRLDTNKEVDLDMETITKLIAAGADIEIL